MYVFFMHLIANAEKMKMNNIKTFSYCRDSLREDGAGLCAARAFVCLLCTC